MTAMSLLALTFIEPWMLIGLLAAGIPPLLHLLSRVRAKEEPFPTLRFLKHCLEKTARRRRIEHWLLMLLRMIALAVLAIAVAEPISRAAGWATGGDDVAVLLLDNSDSMAVGQGSETRLARAKRELAKLLQQSSSPAMSAVLPTTGAGESATLSTQLGEQREREEVTTIAYSPNLLTGRFVEAAELLSKQTNPKRSIYYFGDLQRNTLTPLLESDALSAAAGAKLFFVDSTQGEVDNVGITDVFVTGPCIAGAPVTFSVTILNSSPSPRRVDVACQPADQTKSAGRITKSLSPAGQDGAKATLTFTHSFAQPGWSMGEIRIEQADDLLADNTWRYCVDVSPPVRALVVRETGQGDAGAMLSLALDWRSETQADRPWPIRVTDVQADAFTPQSLSAATAVFFCDVPTFAPQAVDALKQFAQAGGVVWFFLGPNVNVADYNDRFGAKGAELLPGVLGEPVGQVGPGAKVFGVADVAEEHPLFAGLFDAPADYRTTRTQRYVSIEPSPTAGRVLMTLSDGTPLLLEQPMGRGRVYWCMTTADTQWSNLPTQPIFLPMVVRAAMQAAGSDAIPAMFTAGATVEIPLDRRATGAKQLRVTPPNTDTPILVDVKNAHTRFAQTNALGIYRWDAVDAAGTVLAGGAFVVNPYGPESDLVAYTPEQLRAELQSRGISQAFVAPTLDDLQSQATEAAQGRNYWDVLAVAVILLLLAEAFAANRRNQGVRSQETEVRM